MNYTYIDNDLKKTLKLDYNEFAVVAIISNLANGKLNTMGGWCYMSRQKMADELGFSKAGLIGIIDRLINKKMIERHADTKNLRPTNLVPIGKLSIPSVKNLYQSGKESIPEAKKNHAQIGKETIPNIDNKNNKEEILKKFNETFNKGFKTIDDKNFNYWMTVYSKEEVCEAISAAAKDDYWKDIITPTILFRTKDDKGAVDRIGDFLNKRTAPVKYKVIGG